MPTLAEWYINTNLYVDDGFLYLSGVGFTVLLSRNFEC